MPLVDVDIRMTSSLCACKQRALSSHAAAIVFSQHHIKSSEIIVVLNLYILILALTAINYKYISLNSIHLVTSAV